MGAVLVCWMTKSCYFDRRPAPQAQMTAMTGMRSTVSVSSGTPVAAAASSVPVVTGTPVAAAAVSVASGMPVHVKVPHGTKLGIDLSKSAPCTVVRVVPGPCGSLTPNLHYIESINGTSCEGMGSDEVISMIKMLQEEGMDLDMTFNELTTL